MSGKIPERDLPELARRFDEGEKLRQLAAPYGCTTAALSVRLKKFRGGRISYRMQRKAVTKVQLKELTFLCKTLETVKEAPQPRYMAPHSVEPSVRKTEKTNVYEPSTFISPPTRDQLMGSGRRRQA